MGAGQWPPSPARWTILGAVSSGRWNRGRSSSSGAGNWRGARRGRGVGLAREHPVEADLVMGVPDSSIAAAIGYARESGIPFTEGLLKNRYVGRTFIEPDQRLRELGVKLKFNPLPEVLEGKRLGEGDDSIVRGTPTPRVVALLRRAGGKGGHLRICAPPIRYPCFFG